MENNFLQEFLKTGLFEIGDSDGRLDSLKKSIAELQKKFSKNISLLPKYTLVAIDPNISDSEPAIIETEKIIIKYWETLRSKYPEMPISIIRGVILNALYNIGISHPVAARIIYFTALNLYPYAKLNKEASIFKSMLEKFGEIAERNAVEEWSLTEVEPSLKLSTLKITGFKFGTVSIDVDSIQPSLRTAINNNPTTTHGSNHGGASSWGDHFASTAAQGITDAFNLAFSKLNQSINPASLETPINNFFVEFKKSLDVSLKSTFSSLIAVERRSKLLWWKETLYSNILKESYRNFDKNILPVIMGFDLNKQLPEITPISVDYLLKDTLFLLNDKKNDLIKFSDYLKAISQESLKIILKPFFKELNENEGRISLTDFISLFVNDKINLKEFKSKTGIDPNEKTSLEELSVAILHDLLIKRLIAE